MSCSTSSPTSRSTTGTPACACRRFTSTATTIRCSRGYRRATASTPTTCAWSSCPTADTSSRRSSRSGCWRGSSASSRRANEPRGHRPDLELSSPAGNCGIAGGEFAQLVLVLGLDDTEAPRSRAVQHRPEDHHPTRVDESLPVSRVTAHDLPLPVGHVLCEGRTRSFEPEDEGAHGPSLCAEG